MGKVLLFLAMALGFAWAYPPTRARVILAVEPGLERLGPLGEKALAPMQRYFTGNEIKFIVNQISLARTEGREIPDERTFQRWLARRVLTKNNGKDPWGHPYFLLRVGRSLTVGSIGEDGQRGTDDDITESIPF